MHTDSNVPHTLKHRYRLKDTQAYREHVCIVILSICLLTNIHTERERLTERHTEHRHKDIQASVETHTDTQLPPRQAQTYLDIHTHTDRSSAKSRHTHPLPLSGSEH